MWPECQRPFAKELMVQNISQNHIFRDMKSPLPGKYSPCNIFATTVLARELMFILSFRTDSSYTVA